MKAILLALFISTQAFAAIPLNGDDERSIGDQQVLHEQSEAIKQITKKMNIVLVNYASIKEVDHNLGQEINELAFEVEYLHDTKVELDGQYLKSLEEDIDLYKDEIEFLTK